MDYSVSSLLEHLIGASEYLTYSEESRNDSVQALRDFIDEYGLQSEIKKVYGTNSPSDPAEFIRQMPDNPATRYSMLGIERRILAIRTTIEDFLGRGLLPETEKRNLDTLYGPANFKCPKAWCMNFQHGFDRLPERNRHVNRHENPFICPDEDCPLRELGFDTKTSLDRHVRQYHSSNLNSTEATFPQRRQRIHDTLGDAAKRGDLKAVQKFITQGADVNHTTYPKKRGQTPLFLAAMNGHLAVCDILVRHGAYPSYQPSSAKAILLAAIEHEKEDIVRYLIDVVGAPCRSRNEEEWSGSILQAATATGNPEILKIVLNNTRERFQASEIKYALLLAAERGYTDSVREMIKSNTINSLADLGLGPVRKRTPLHVAAESGHIEVVRLLIDSGKMYPDPEGTFDGSPVQLAIQRGHLSEAMVLFEFDPRFGEELLLFVGERGDHSLARDLLNMREFPIDQAIYKAAMRGDTTTAHTLLASQRVNGSTIDNTRKNKVGSDWYAVWNPSAQKVVDLDLSHDFIVSTDVTSVTFSEDGNYLAVCGLKLAYIYDLMEGEGEKVGSIIIEEEDETCYLRTACFSPNSNCLVAGGDADNIWVCDPLKAAPLPIPSNHTQSITTLIFTRDGLQMASGGKDGFVRLWDVSAGWTLKHSLEAPHAVTTLQISPDNRYVLAGDIGGVISIWELATNALTKRLGGMEGHSYAVDSLTFSLDGLSLISYNLEKAVTQWNLSLFNPMVVCDEPVTHQIDKEAVFCIRHSHNRRWLLYCTMKGDTKIHDSVSGEVQLVLRGHQDLIYCLSYSPSGAMFATGSIDGHVKIWTLAEKSP
ncbi:hypothetical protein CBS63078_10542 [Aspergillus niger]|nr:hypothetical protein CBS63078_10542 [Aspergillus niger]KAI2932284.1 hypothetical protein CBS147321_9959 [Aspergillus niger]